MRHVDDGTLHAWLDEALEAADAATVASHLEACDACRARLDEERALRAQAGALLDLSAPVVDRPAFERLVARAEAAGRSDASPYGHAVASPPEQATVRPFSRTRASWLAVGWAASLALAVAIGWAARDLLQPPEDRATVVAMASEPPVDAIGPAPAAGAEEQVAPAPQAGADALDPDVRRRAAPAQVPEGSPRAASSAAGASPDTVPALAGATSTLDEAPASADAGDGPVVTPPGRAENRETAPEDRETVQGIAPRVDAASAARQRAASSTLERESRASDAAGAAPASEAFAGVPVAAPPPPSAAAAADWRPLPRTEAAVRTGMPLYGIEGLAPTETSISSDGLRVRTRYLLDTGESVSLLQLRDTMPVSVLTGDPSPLAPARPAGLAQPVFRSGLSMGRTMTTVRGDVRLTLESATPTPRLDELAGRLRID